MYNYLFYELGFEVLHLQNYFSTIICKNAFSSLLVKIQK